MQAIDKSPYLKFYLYFMIIKQKDFEEMLKGSELSLAFVAMSNAGKTYRSKVLQEEAGFFHYSVDDEIQKELNIKSMEEISEWLSFPDLPSYKEREAKYLELENRFTKVEPAIVKGVNFILDTTGSVIYLEEETLKYLQENFLIVNMEISENVMSELLERFFANPKPLIWQDSFEQLPGESRSEALQRCYPKLLKARLKAYRELADVTIPADLFKDKSAGETLEIIRSALPY